MARPVGAPAVTRTPSWSTPSSAQRRQQAAAEVVVADAADHAYPGAEPRHRLVGALPAGREPGRRAQHGRAGFGQPRDGDRDIHVQAAQHGDPHGFACPHVSAPDAGAAEPGGGEPPWGCDPLTEAKIGLGIWHCRRAAWPSTLGVCLVSSVKSTSSPISRTPATRSRSCSAPTGLSGERDAAVRAAGRTCRRRRSCWRPGPTRGPTTWSGSSRPRRRAAVRRDIPRWAPVTPGSAGGRPAGPPGRDRAGVRAPASSRCGGLAARPPGVRGAAAGALRPGRR